jgi:hypothetical protein
LFSFLYYSILFSIYKVRLITDAKSLGLEMANVMAAIALKTMDVMEQRMTKEIFLI